MVRKILVVDNNLQASAATEQLLATAGYWPTTVASFEDAALSVSRDCPDLLVTAVRLGRFNGLHLVLRARADCPNLPVVVVGETADTALEADAAQFGVRFVTKQTAPRDFLVLVAELLHLNTTES